jgi:hypothetical protein
MDDGVGGDRPATGGEDENAGRGVARGGWQVQRRPAADADGAPQRKEVDEASRECIKNKVGREKKEK